MEDKKGIFSFLKVDSIVKNFTGLIENRVELFKIELKEDAAKAGSRIVVLMIIALSLFMAVLFLSIGLSFFIGRFLNNEMLGFFVVGGIFLLILVLIIFMNKFFNINKKLEKIILEILDNDANDGDGDE